MHIDHEHTLGETHSHQHTHIHDGVTHTHAHQHEHDHTHQHPHTHDQLHQEGQAHTHDHPETPMDELLALMKYMVGHNASHANELAELAVKLDEAGSHDSYHKVMDAVACFRQGNDMLCQVLDALKD